MRLVSWDVPVLAGVAAAVRLLSDSIDADQLAAGLECEPLHFN
jgi:hypothetical protein